MILFKKIRRKAPINYILLFIITASMSLAMAALASVLKHIILILIAVKIAEVGGLAILALVKKIDLNKCIGIICVLSLATVFTFIFNGSCEMDTAIGSSLFYSGYMIFFMDYSFLLPLQGYQ